jgi:hypothetical protein
MAAAALAALGVTAGGGSASAATAQFAGPPITGVNWHQLILINGWVSDGRLYSNSFPLSESGAFTSLAGISYPVGS